MSQNLERLVKKTFKEYISDFIKKIESSRSNLKTYLTKLDKETFQNVANHYNSLNNSYQESKDILNNFIIMIFSEITSTYETNFQIVQQQLNFLYENVVSQFIKSSKQFEESLNGLKTDFNYELKKFSHDLGNYFSQFKQERDNLTDVLVENIQTHIEISEMQVFSNVIKVLDTFTVEFSKESENISQEIQEKFKVSVDKFEKDLNSFNQKIQGNFSKFLSAHEEKITKIKDKIEENLNLILEDQTKLYEKYKIAYIEAFSSETGEVNQEIERIQKEISEKHDNYTEELDKLSNNNQKIFKGITESISKSEGYLRTMLENESPTDPEAFRKEIGTVLNTLNNLKKQNQNFQKDLDKTTKNNLQGLLKDKESLDETLDKIPNKLETVFAETNQGLDKEITSKLKEVESNINKMRSKTGLFGNLDEQNKAFRSIAKDISDTYTKMKKTYDKALTNSLKDLTSSIKTSLYTIDKRLKDDMVVFYKNFEDYMSSTIITMKEVSSEILSSSPELSQITLPEIDDAFKNLISLFETHLKDSKERYRELIQVHHNSLIPVIESFEKDTNENISLFESNQEKIFQQNQIQHNQIFKILQESYKSQFSEFEDRINQDLTSLLNANQELISRIMIKSAKTSSEFNEQAEKHSKVSEDLVNEFFKKLETVVINSGLDFQHVSDQIKNQILKQISKNL